MGVPTGNAERRGAVNGMSGTPDGQKCTIVSTPGYSMTLDPSALGSTCHLREGYDGASTRCAQRWHHSIEEHRQLSQWPRQDDLAAWRLRGW